ncbi:hypothetical protein GPECTOR_10g1076 [Gonium pectorale]|uniref:Bidirectional sugar transporter SWEET n=1 Tax=Gonium pectorale TaxID=33097 RepID=A0A150GQJ5_GONPE|nr:hypothetical protein GPECTOR_10g1076 [Gonium pectorale]|eukprot:KXZ52053.1 hypothetical protein GPECTOR_10g1076 [Gonium pectorale]
MSNNVLLDTVVPALGAIVSTAMYLSPLKAVLRASRDKSLGELNPLPLSITIANTLAWTSYGLLKRDPFVTAPNTVGILISVFMTLTAFGLADEQTPPPSPQGLAGNVVCLIYYAAPLSTMWEVIRTRNSASILVPLTMMNTLNAALWTTYGIAVLDPYIWLPNGIGLALSLLQIALRLLFPSRPGASLPSHQHHSTFTTTAATTTTSASPKHRLHIKQHEPHHLIPHPHPDLDAYPATRPNPTDPTDPDAARPDGPDGPLLPVSAVSSSAVGGGKYTRLDESFGGVTGPR